MALDVEGAASARGRRRGSPDTRDAIVLAARELFAERGVAGASVRAIAERAGVHASLLMHFYGSKAGLLEATVDWPFDLDASRSSLMSGGIDEVGERLARQFVEVWDTAGAEHPILLLLRVSGTDAAAARHLTDLLESRLLTPLWPALATQYGSTASIAHTRERGALIASQLLGLALSRYVLRLDAIATMTADDLAASIGPTLQRLIAGPFQTGARDVVTARTPR